jgi:competence protein ComEC
MQLARFTDALAAEQNRWGLWIPAGLGVGISAYFSLGEEPPFWLGLCLVTVALLFVVCLRHRRGWAAISLAVALAVTGFTAAQIRTATLRTPLITEAINGTQVVGRVAYVERQVGASRVTLERLRIQRLAPDRTPEQIRLSLRQPVELRPGDWVSLRAGLLPSPPPTAPGAFDFQRRAYFDGIGGIGYALGPLQVTATAAGAGHSDPALMLAEMRQSLTERIRDNIGGVAGAIAAALITGERGEIPESVIQAMRDSGLAHLLAISGLNIGIVAGILFGGARLLLALIPPLALRHPIKKWAAAVGILGALAYTLISGGTVPTLRSFLMTALILGAVMLDRRGLSMHLVAWAATVVLLLQPEALLGASFQLSFSAVVALIAVYEWLVRFQRGHTRSWLGKAALYVGGVALSTLVAGAATAPFAIYHFNRYAAFALAANMLAIPLNVFWIMPWAVVAMVLMPFGYGDLPLTLMGWGIDAMVKIAETVAGWPGAVTLLPAMPDWGIAAVTLGGLWLCFWTKRWRLWGGMAVALGMGSLAATELPHVLIDGRGNLAAVRSEAGQLALSSPASGRFVQAAWLRLAGQEESPAYWPTEGVSADGRLACDRRGCLYSAEGRTVALIRSPEALSEDCWSADVLVAPMFVRRRNCSEPTVLIDRAALIREGAHAVWLGDKIRVRSVNETRGRRPWVVRPPERGGRRPG